VRVFAVVLSVLYALAYGIPTVLYLGGHYGSVGITKAGAIGTLPPNGDVNTVGTIAAGSPAARAGIVPGDAAVRLELERAPAFEQLFDRLVAGRPQPYAVLHEGQRRIVTLTPQALHPSSTASTLIVAQLIRGLAIVLIGALLVLLRPSIMTAAFYILCLQFGELAHPVGNLELVAALPPLWKPFFLALTCFVNGAGPAVAAIFCMRFPTGRPLPSWRPVEKAMIAVAAFTIADYFAALALGGTYTALGSRLYGIFSVASWLSYAVATAAFLVRYLHASGEDRDRLRWVAIGLGSFLLSYALFWISQNVPSAPYSLSNWAQFLNVLPLTVLYAVVRHRVIDVRVVGGRALAYAVLSGVPVLLLKLIDALVSRQLQQTKLALVAEVTVALGFGFWLNASKRKIDDLIEWMFFHARRIAEERLRRVARRIAHATERDVVDDMLVREPFEALQLSAIALYRRAEGAYVRGAHCGWPDDALPLIDGNDALALELIATREPVPIDAIAWQAARTLAGVRPNLAFPVIVRYEVVGMLLLGEKRDGERVDGLELAAVQSLVVAAGMAYDHLDAVEQQRIADDLRHALDSAHAENQTLRGLLGREPSGV
jgi:hypothetical protein